MLQYQKNTPYSKEIGMNTRIIYLYATLICLHNTMQSGEDDRATTENNNKNKTVVNVYPGNVNVTNNNDNTNNNANDTNVSNTVVNKIKTKMESFVEQSVKYVSEISPREVASSAYTYLAMYKLPILVGTTGSIYLTLFTIIFMGNRFLTSDTTWASWKKDQSLEELQELSQDKLGKELIRDVQKRHINKANPTDYISPLVQFVQTVEKETKIVNHYLQLAVPLRWTRLSYIFPINNKSFEHAQEARKRLIFVKHIFISWTAQDNLGNFNH